jgi:hypothetical protein
MQGVMLLLRPVNTLSQKERSLTHFHGTVEDLLSGSPNIGSIQTT